MKQFTFEVRFQYPEEVSDELRDALQTAMKDKLESFAHQVLDAGVQLSDENFMDWEKVEVRSS